MSQRVLDALGKLHEAKDAIEEMEQVLNLLRLGRVSSVTFTPQQLQAFRTRLAALKAEVDRLMNEVVAVLTA